MKKISSNGYDYFGEFSSGTPTGFGGRVKQNVKHIELGSFINGKREGYFSELLSNGNFLLSKYHNDCRVDSFSIYYDKALKHFIIGMYYPAEKEFRGISYVIENDGTVYKKIGKDNSAITLETIVSQIDGEVEKPTNIMFDLPIQNLSDEPIFIGTMKDSTACGVLMNDMEESLKAGRFNLSDEYEITPTDLCIEVIKEQENPTECDFNVFVGFDSESFMTGTYLRYSIKDGQISFINFVCQLSLSQTEKLKKNEDFFTNMLGVSLCTDVNGESKYSELNEINEENIANHYLYIYKNRIGIDSKDEDYFVPVGEVWYFKEDNDQLDKFYFSNSTKNCINKNITILEESKLKNITKELLKEVTSVSGTKDLIIENISDKFYVGQKGYSSSLCIGAVLFLENNFITGCSIKNGKQYGPRVTMDENGGIQILDSDRLVNPFTFDFNEDGVAEIIQYVDNKKNGVGYRIVPKSSSAQLVRYQNDVLVYEGSKIIRTLNHNSYEHRKEIRPRRYYEVDGNGEFKSLCQIDNAGKICGNGIYITKSCELLFGDFEKPEVLNGIGVRYYNGVISGGHFISGRHTGFGFVRYFNGDIFIGDIVDGSPNGYGFYFSYENLCLDMISYQKGKRMTLARIGEFGGSTSDKLSSKTTNLDEKKTNFEQTTNNEKKEDYNVTRASYEARKRDFGSVDYNNAFFYGSHCGLEKDGDGAYIDADRNTT